MTIDPDNPYFDTEKIEKEAFDNAKAAQEFENKSAKLLGIILAIVFSAIFIIHFSIAKHTKPLRNTLKRNTNQNNHLVISSGKEARDISEEEKENLKKQIINTGIRIYKKELETYSYPLNQKTPP